MSKVLILAGGLSHERDISLRSGSQVADALRRKGFDVVVSDVDRNLLSTIDTVRPDVIWPVIHGAPGENGSLRDVLTSLGIPYVGPTGEAARLAWDKSVAKTLVRVAGVAAPRGVAVSNSTFRELGAARVLSHLADQLGLPLVVKPARCGSALGVGIVREVGALPAAMVDAYSYDDMALLETYVVGTEVSVAVLEGAGGELTALPPVEIQPVSGDFDFDAMYNAGSTEYFTPARLSPEASAAACAAALTAHRVLGHRHVSRTDLIVDSDGVAWFLECSVSPGMTPTSVVPLAIRGAGLTFSDVLADLVDLVAGAGPAPLSSAQEA